MFRSLVVPLDGSPLAAKALPYVAQIADPTARITLVGVIQLSFSAHCADDAELMARGSDLMWREVETHATRLRKQGLHVVTTVRSGNPTEEIIACAKQAQADLIVMTTHGRGGLQRWALGSVANQLLHTTAIPTLMIRVSEADSLVRVPTLDGVIAPLDGSPAAEAALPTAESLAARLSAPIHLIRVVAAQPSDGAMEAQEQQCAAEYLERIAARLTSADCITRTDVRVGGTAASLADAFTARPHAMVVIATHGKQGDTGWVFGSVAETVISTAANPTLVLRLPGMKSQPKTVQAEATATRYPD